ncbi:MAG: hypothetical protein AAES65_11480 [Candidatus Thiodiazotropha sp. (ex. Lucinoma kazani)]
MAGAGYGRLCLFRRENPQDPKLEEDIRKDLKLGVSSDPDIALRWDVRRSTVSNIRRKLKKRPIEERGNLRENPAPLTPKKIELINKDLKSGKYSNPKIAHRHGVSLSTVERIKDKLKKLPPGERGNLRLRGNYKNHK